VVSFWQKMMEETSQQIQQRPLKEFQLVIALRDEDRLCLIHEEDGESHEPKIICSMGLVGKNK